MAASSTPKSSPKSTGFTFQNLCSGTACYVCDEGCLLRLTRNFANIKSATATLYRKLEEIIKEIETRRGCQVVGYAFGRATINRRKKGREGGSYYTLDIMDPKTWDKSDLKLHWERLRRSECGRDGLIVITVITRAEVPMNYSSDQHKDYVVKLEEELIKYCMFTKNDKRAQLNSANVPKCDGKSQGFALYVTIRLSDYNDTWGGGDEACLVTNHQYYSLGSNSSTQSPPPLITPNVVIDVRPQLELGDHQSTSPQSTQLAVHQSLMTTTTGPVLVQRTRSSSVRERSHKEERKRGSPSLEMEEENRQLRAQLLELSEKLNLRETELHRVMEENAQLNARLRIAVEERKQTASQFRRQLSNQKEEAEEEKEKAVTELVERLQIKDAENTVYMEDFKSERADRERIHSELEELRERLAQSEEQIMMERKQLKKRNKQLEINNAALNNELIKLKEKAVEEIQALQAQVNAHSEEYEKQKGLLTGGLKQKEEAQEEIQVLTAQVNAYSRECEKQKGLVAQNQEKHKTEVIRLNGEIHGLQEEIHRLREEIQRAREESEAAKTASKVTMKKGHSPKKTGHNTHTTSEEMTIKHSLPINPSNSTDDTVFSDGATPSLPTNPSISRRVASLSSSIGISTKSLIQKEKDSTKLSLSNVHCVPNSASLSADVVKEDGNHFEVELDKAEEEERLRLDKEVDAALFEVEQVRKSHKVSQSLRPETAENGLVATSVHTELVKNDKPPYDPNLVCPKCGKQYRMGQIQRLRRHIKERCNGE